ncbi:MAG: ABC transporter ATP-binding protein [Eubacteriales bacterium]|jgi:putative ABC transport system ATP-binding protein
MIRCDSLNKTYMQGDTPIRAVRDCNISIEKGSFTAITGASGSGKSTLLNLLAGFDVPTTGRVLYDNENIYEFGESRLSEFHSSRIGFIFQEFRLLPILTAKENILMPALIAKKKYSEHYFKELVEILGLSGRLDHLPDELSGGERQRTAAARALINRPSYLFADEPTGNLDRENADNLIELLLKLHETYGTTLVVATHDTEIAKKADTVWRIHDGSISRGR